MWRRLHRAIIPQPTKQSSNQIIMTLILPCNRSGDANHLVLPSKDRISYFQSRPTSMCNLNPFRDTDKPILNVLSHGSHSDSSFEEGDGYTWENDIREEAPSLHHGTKSKSRAIPIPDTYVADEDDVSEQAKHRYNLATWNMYERIVNYRKRNRIGGAYSQDDITLLATEKNDSPKTKYEPYNFYPGVNYYDMKEEIFDMEI